MIKRLANIYNNLKLKGMAVEAEELFDLMVEAGYGDFRADNPSVINEEEEPKKIIPPTYKTPKGMFLVKHLNAKLKTSEPERISDYNWDRVTVPRPGTWSENHGVIAACDFKGNIYSWIDDISDVKYSYDYITESLKNGQFVRLQFYVPFSE